MVMGRVASCLASLHASGRAHGSLSLACMMVVDGASVGSVGCAELEAAAPARRLQEQMTNTALCMQGLRGRGGDCSGRPCTGSNVHST